MYPLERPDLVFILSISLLNSEGADQGNGGGGGWSAVAAFSFS